MTEIEELNQKLSTVTRQRDTAIAVLIHKTTDVVDKELSLARNRLLKELDLEKEFVGVPVKRWK